MSSFFIEFGVILLLVALNGLFALSEMAIVTAKQMRLQQQVEKEMPGAKAALSLSQNPGTFLSTVQLGITLVGVISGAFGGAALAKYVEPLFAWMPVIGEFSDALSILVVVILITYLSLVIGELVPKQLAIRDPEGFARKVAPMMVWLSKIGKPLVKVLSWSTDQMVRLFGNSTQSDQNVTDEDLRMLIDQGAMLGVLNRREELMMEQVLNFDESRIESLITPRPKVIWLDIDDDQSHILSVLEKHQLDRYPVAHGDLDYLLGVVTAADLLHQQLTTGKINLSEIIRPPVIVPDSLNILETIQRMRQNKIGIVFVLNEYGGVDGLITEKNLLSALRGYSPQTDTSFDPPIVERKDHSWLLDGMLPMTTLRELIGLKPLTEETMPYQTLSGLAMAELGRIPETGDIFLWEDVRFEIVDMDGKRVDKVLAAVLPKDTEAQ